MVSEGIVWVNEGMRRGCAMGIEKLAADEITVREITPYAGSLFNGHA